MKPKNTWRNCIIVLCSSCAVALFNGCVRHTPLAITSHYAFPVEVDDATLSDYGPRSLGVIAPGAVLNADLVGSGTFHILDVRRVRGKSIKQVSVTCDEGTLVIGR